MLYVMKGGILYGLLATGVLEKAVRYLRQAGQTAVRLSDNESALATQMLAAGLLTDYSDATRMVSTRGIV